MEWPNADSMLGFIIWAMGFIAAIGFMRFIMAAAIGFIVAWAAGGTNDIWSRGAFLGRLASTGTDAIAASSNYFGGL